MILSNVSVPLLGMVDTGVTGHLDSPVYLGAVAIGAMIFSFLYTGVNFLRMGTTGIAAQSFGADDNDGLRVALGQAAIVALLIAGLLLVLQVPIGRIQCTCSALIRRHKFTLSSTSRYGSGARREHSSITH